MRKAFLIIPVVLLVMTACSGQSGTGSPEETPTLTATLADPQVFRTPAPDVESAVSAFLGAWQSEDYAVMYQLLSSESQGAIPEADFTAKYLDTAVALTLKLEDGIDYDILTTQTNPDQAEATVSVDFHTYFFGTLTRPLVFDMVREPDGWHVNWNAAMILPELADGNTLEIVRQETSRGNIYARDGSPIAAQDDVVAIGFTPGGLNENLLSLFYTTMAQLTIYQVDEIIEMADNALPGDYISLGEVPQSEVDKNLSALSRLSGVFLNYYSSRFYYEGGIAPQAVGHLTYISEEEQYTYLRMGYSINERFGSTGLEAAFEEELSGQRGASLYLKDANGQILSKLADRASSPG